MSPGVLADLIVIVHFLYLIFTVLGELLVITGGFLHWKWVKKRGVRIPHLIAVLLVAMEAFAGLLCPLTSLEYNLRKSAGQPVDESMSFAARLIHKIIFYDLPDRFFIFLYAGFGALVILTMLFVPIEKRK